MNEPRRAEPAQPSQAVAVVGGDIVTMNPKREVLLGATVVMQGNRIADVGPTKQVLARWPQAQQLSASGCVITPGLINTHQHLTGDPLLRSTIPDKITTQQAIFDWAVPAHRAHSGEDEQLSATLCAAESVLRGVTTVLEAGTVAHPQAVAEGLDSVGVRAVMGIWGSDTPGLPLSGSVAEVIDRQRQLLLDFPAGGQVEGWVALVGHDLASDELLRAASQLAADKGVGMTLHISPTPADGERWMERCGKRPLEHFLDLGIMGPQLLLGHAVWLDEPELEILLDSQTAVAFCPRAYLRLGQGTTRAGRHLDIFKRGGRLGLGADAHNAGDDADMLAVAALCAGLWRDMSMEPESFGAHDAFELLTLGGADVLGKTDELGSLEVGKLADLVVFDTRDVCWTPRGDVGLQLIWGGVSHTVRDVFVGGRQVVGGFELVGVELAELSAQAGERLRGLLAEAGLAETARESAVWPQVAAD